MKQIDSFIKKNFQSTTSPIHKPLIPTGTEGTTGTEALEVLEVLEVLEGTTLYSNKTRPDRRVSLCFTLFASLPHDGSRAVAGKWGVAP
jgi:hypothetical protein